MTREMPLPKIMELSKEKRTGSKHAPKELRSDRPVSRHKKVVFYQKLDDPEKGHFEPKRRPRDPRFDRSSGTFNSFMFEKSYEFLAEYRENEVKELEELLHSPGWTDKQQLMDLLSRKKQEILRDKDKKRIEKIKRETKRKEREMVLKGKKPFFPKKKDLKIRAQTEKLEELKEAGGLEKYLKKKAKRERSREAADTYAFSKKVKRH